MIELSWLDEQGRLIQHMKGDGVVILTDGDHILGLQREELLKGGEVIEQGIGILKSS